MPSRIAARPRHKGLPVPSSVQYDAHGVPDFRVIDMEKWTGLARSRGCGICGATMGARLWFVGGPLAIENRLFTDLPMHKDCAEFALQVCPFLAMPRFKFNLSKVELPGKAVVVNEDVSIQRPERFGLAASSGYRLVTIEGGNGSVMLQAREFSAVEWWREGKMIGGNR